MDTDRDRSPEGPAAAGRRGPGPARVGPYELLEMLGRGGMGPVYLARHVHLKRPVALKVLAPGRVLDARAIARFFQEMESGGKFDHPNLVRATDGGEIDRRLFLVMDLVEGVDLGRLARQVGTLAVADACELARQAAEGLQCVCDHGLVHRDIKPSNLMLRADGVVKILDLGLARLAEGLPGDEPLTASGEVVGTVDYMAPEQGGAGRRVDIRSDLYSLGCTLYRLLAGAAPFGGLEYDTNLKKMMAHALVPALPIRVLRPEVPAALEALLETLMAKDPAGRADLRALAARARAEVRRDPAAADPFDETCAEPSGLSPTQSFSRTEEVRPDLPVAGDPLPPTKVDTFRLPLEFPRDCEDSAASVTTPIPAPGPKPSAPSGDFGGWLRRKPHGGRRWMRDLALVLILIAALALVGLASILRREPSNPPGPLPVSTPKPQPPPRPIEGVAFDPLRAAPTVLRWPMPSKHPFMHHDEKKRTLRISSDDFALLALGEAPAGCRYTLETSVEQTPWVGGTGFFFGARRTRIHGKAGTRYQTVELANGRDERGEEVFFVRRRVVNMSEFEFPDILMLQSAPVARPEPASQHRLGITVGPDGLESVRWDGRELPALVERIVEDGLEADDFHAHFGVVNWQGSSYFSDGSYLYRKGADRVGTGR